MAFISPQTLYDERVAQAWMPPPNLTIREWAETNLVLPYGSQPGLYSSDFAAYQKGILDAISDPTIEKITIMAGSQTGKSLISLIVIGYFIDCDPSNIIYIRESKDKAQEYANQELSALHTIPKLKDYLSDDRERNRGKGKSRTKLKKYFPGGYLILTGSESAASLAGLSCRVVICDEISKFKPIPGFGNVVNLAESRTNTFLETRKMIFISVPGEIGPEGEPYSGSIEDLYQQGDQRRFEVPCPHCGGMQDLKFTNVIYEHCREKLDSIFYRCEHCSGHIYQQQLREAVRQGQWRATAEVKAENEGHASFNILGLSSPFLNMKEIVKRFLQAKNDSTALRPFLNDTLGESWVDREAEAISTNALMERREAYGPAIPIDVGLLTAGVDIQGDRLECSVWGWGKAKRSWLVSHTIYHGSPAEQAVWDNLYADLTRDYDHASGESIRISRVFIDSQGTQGHPDSVHRFVRMRHKEGIFAIVGSNNSGAPLLPKTYTRAGALKVRVLELGVSAAKDYIYHRLNIAKGDPGSVQFPMSVEDEYFKQLMAEKRVKRVVSGQLVTGYKQTRARNEALDCYVYALCAYEHHQKQYQNIDQLCDEFLIKANSNYDGLPLGDAEEEEAVVEKQSEAAPKPVEVSPTPRPAQSKWVQKKSRTAISW